MKLDQLQTEHAAWLQRKYPGQPPQLPAAGMVEEAGELLHAILAKWREDLFGPDPRYPAIHADIVDAIGDCVIYFCSWCNTVDWQLADFETPPLTSTASLQTLAVQLVATAAMFYETGDPPLAYKYVALLKRLAHNMLIDFDGAVSKTWEGVKCR